MKQDIKPSTVKTLLMRLLIWSCIATLHAAQAQTREGTANVQVQLPAHKNSGVDADDKPKPDSAKTKNTTEEEKDKEESAPKPYNTIIPAEAKTQKGILIVHRVKDKWFYEIPLSEFGKDFLWVTRLRTGPESVDRGGERYKTVVVRWEKRENRILLRQQTYQITSESSQQMSEEVRRSNESPIIAVFPVEAIAPGGAPVIDITKFYVSDNPELGAKDLLGGSSIEEKRSFIDTFRVYPQNIETEITATYNLGSGGSAENKMKSSSGVVTAVVHFSLIRLAEKPMRPRLADDRVGFFYDEHLDYSSESEQKAVKRRLIWRYNLVKKDPSAAVSDPVHPIIYYIDPATPKAYVPYIKAGVAEWNVALEKAGFSNAILALDVPTDDPDWSQEDVRHSMIRWLPSTTQNAQGATIKDPRSGEILNASVSIWYNVISLVRKWYFVQASPLDPSAQRFPFPEELMGRLVQYVIAHEIGHTLGLEHNFLASSEYPTDKLRDPKWVKVMGHSPSIMDYSRFNYVAQPEDGIDPRDLIPSVGPYDIWAIHWGYAPIPASSAEDERPTLNKWADQQDSVPWLRFQYVLSGGFDPGVQPEAVGDADPLESAKLGVQNLKRVMSYIFAATTTQPGDSYASLRDTWDSLKSQYDSEVGGVLLLVGGLRADNKHVGQPGPIWSVVPVAEQRNGLKFLMDQKFNDLPFYDQPNLRRYFQIGAGVGTFRNSQALTLKILFNGGLLSRMREEEQTYGKDAYSVDQLVADLHAGVWREVVSSGKVAISSMRRSLENTYVDTLDNYLNHSPLTAWYGLQVGVSTPVTTLWELPVYRLELERLQKQVRSAIPRAATSGDREHLKYLSDQIDRALHPVPALPTKDITPIGLYPGPTDLEGPRSW